MQICHISASSPNDLVLIQNDSKMEFTNSLVICDPKDAASIRSRRNKSHLGSNT